MIKGCSVFLGLWFVFGSVSASAQTRDCFEIRGLEFFVAKELQNTKWSENELEALLTTGKREIDSSWMVPVILMQLRAYYPNCHSLTPDTRLGLLLRLHASIRPDLRLTNLPTEKKIEAIREDFYTQVNNDKLIRTLIYTMDDGPLYGRVASFRQRKGDAPTLAQSFAFGKVRVDNLRNKVQVTGIDLNGKVLWSRILKGLNPERFLRKASDHGTQVVVSEFIISYRFYVDGERLTIYMRPDGRFLYYNHSW